MRGCRILLAGTLLIAGMTLALSDTAAWAAPAPLTFAVMSDIHVQSWDRQAIRKFGRALVDLQEASPQAEALIINGDLGNGFPEDYRTLNQLLTRNPHPPQVYYTIGNHEFYKSWHNHFRHWSAETFPNGESDRDAVARFLRQSGESKVYYEKKLKGFTFLFLGSERYRQSDPSYKENAYLSDEQLNWLSDRLKEAAGQGRPIFVFLHQPLPGTVSGSIPGGSGRGVVQADRLKKLLSAYPQVILFTGHTHWELSLPHTVVQDRFVMVNSSSVSQPWAGLLGPYPAEADKSEGLVVEVYPDHVLIKGRDFRDKRWLGRYVVKYS